MLLYQQLRGIKSLTRQSLHLGPAAVTALIPTETESHPTNGCFLSSRLNKVLFNKAFPSKRITAAFAYE